MAIKTHQPKQENGFFGVKIRWILIGLLLIMPALTAWLLPRLLFGASLLNYVPTLTDEIDYWHEIATFSHVGFEGGYYTVEEKPAAAAFTRFGAHGPAFPMLYGVFGRLVGWQVYSGPIFNIVVVTIALVIFIGLTKPEKKQLIITILFLFSFWPLHFFLSTTMMESVNHGIAIMLAGMFYLLLYKQGQVGGKYKFLVGLFIFFASILRFTWIFLLIPFFLLSDRPKQFWQYVFSVAKAFVLAVVSFLAWRYLAAVYEANFITELINTLGQSWIKAGQLLVSHSINNLEKLILFEKGYAIEVLQRYQLVAMIVVLAVAGAIGVRMRRDPANSEKRGTTGPQDEILFHFLNVGLILGVQIIFYDVFEWRDYRVMSAHLLLSVLLMIASLRYTLFVKALVASNLIFTFAFISAFKDIHADSYLYDAQNLEEFRLVTNEFLVYNSQQNPWCNTILTTTLPHQIIMVPPGIGISHLFRDPKFMTFPLKSKYLFIESAMLQENSEDFKQVRDQLKNIQLLASTAQGNLYLNLDSQCN